MKIDLAARKDVARTKGDILLSVHDLCIDGYSDEKWHKIVGGISLTLARGEVLGLIGESGAGKSSVGLATMGYAKPGCRITSGSIVFDCENLVTASAAHKRALRGTRIAYVAQSAMASFNPAHNLFTQTIEAKRRRDGGRRAEAVDEAIRLYKELQLPNPSEIGFRFPHQVSGGQLQRAMTAMAMICKPELIIFDENRRGRFALMVGHDLKRLLWPKAGSGGSTELRRRRQALSTIKIIRSTAMGVVK